MSPLIPRQHGLLGVGREDGELRPLPSPLLRQMGLYDRPLLGLWPGVGGGGCTAPSTVYPTTWLSGVIGGGDGELHLFLYTSPVPMVLNDRQLPG